MATTSYKYNANTGLAQVTTANSNLDGTGALSLVLAGASGGTLIKSITIKAIQTTTQGMVRFFKFNGANYYLVQEVTIPPVAPSSVIAAYGVTIKPSFTLLPTEALYASTQNGQTFNIIAEGLSFNSCACSTVDNSGATIQYFAQNGNTNIRTANSNLDGTGTLGQVFVASASASSNTGTIIQNIIIKGAQANTSQGMIRLYLNNGISGLNYLFSELSIPPSMNSSGLIRTITLNIPISFILQTGYGLYASTQNGESFNVISNGLDFECCAC